jgi:hypothetical protein
MRLLWTVSAVCLALLFSPESLAAQQENRLMAAKTAELSAAGRLRLPAQPLAQESISNGRIAVARPSKGTGETLMVVGGAVLLAGLLADEAIISIAGVAIGGYGLYVYLDADRRRR